MEGKMSYEEIIKELNKIKIEQVRWEADEDIVTINGMPVGSTISHHSKIEVNNWWPGLKRIIAKQLSKEEK
jgi:hypothetical protein